MTNKFFFNLIRNVAGVILAFLAVWGSAVLADTFTQPSVTAPGRNIAAPVNPGVTTQIKTGGGFTANNITVDNLYQFGTTNYYWKPVGTPSVFTVSTQQYCLNGSCISTWPSVSGTTHSCHTDRMTVPISSGGNPYSSSCEGVSVPSGYVPSGSDSCTGIGALNCDHGGPNAVCFFTKITCS